jgi:bacteriorhodopsin
VLISAVSQPWNATLTQAEYLLTLYFLVITALAFLAAFIRAWVTRTEIGSRYRNVTVARLGIVGVTLVSYVLLLVNFVGGYDLVDGVHQPNAGALLAFAPRYMEWSIGVPLLAAELLVVCTLVGTAARRTHALAFAGSFAMIFCGFLGGVVIDDGHDLAALLTWGGISAVFWILTNVVLIRAVRRSLPELTPEASAQLRHATILLLSCWVVYPVVYLIPVFFSGGEWATVIQIALCVTDMVVKIGFGTLLWRVAKYRTAEDVRAGTDLHPESIWISSVKLSDAGLAREIHLDADATVHPRRSMPPASVASPSAEHPHDYTAG